jgi:hypothetical protein
MYMYIYMYIHTNVCMHIRICMYLCTYVCMYIIPVDNEEGGVCMRLATIHCAAGHSTRPKGSTRAIWLWIQSSTRSTVFSTSTTLYVCAPMTTVRSRSPAGNAACCCTLNAVDSLSGSWSLNAARAPSPSFFRAASAVESSLPFLWHIPWLFRHRFGVCVFV